MRGLGAGRVVLVDVLLLAGDALAVHLLQHQLGEPDVDDEAVAAALGEVLAHHHAQHLEVVRVRRHGVGRHHPPARA